MADLPFYLFTVVIYSFGYWLGFFVGRKDGARRRYSWCGHIPPARNPWPPHGYHPQGNLPARMPTHPPGAVR